MLALTRLTGVATIVAALGLTGCESAAEKDAHDKGLIEQGRKLGLDEGEARGKAAAEKAAVEEKEEAEKVAAAKREAALREVRGHPGTFLMAGGFGWRSEGIGPGFQQLSQMNVLNGSGFQLHLKSAQVSYRDIHGADLGSRPLMLNADINPGETKKFSEEEKSLSTAAIKGAVASALVVITEVEVVPPKQ